MVASDVLTAYERDYELDKFTWFFDEMGGGVEGKRNKVLGAVPTLGEHYRPCVVTTGDTQDPFHTTVGIFINNHLLDKPFVIQSGSTVNRNNSDNLPDDWSCGATGKGSMTVDLFMSLCVHHVENNLKPKGYGAGKKASMLVFDGHTSRWSYAGLMFLMANNCWPFCIASHSSAWAQVSGSFVLTLHTNFILPPHPHPHPHCVCVCDSLLTQIHLCSQVGDNALNAMCRAALAKEVALWRSQFGAYIAFTRNDFNKCFVAAFHRVQVRQHAYAWCVCMCGVSACGVRACDVRVWL